MNGLSPIVFPFFAGVLIAIAWQLPFLLYGLMLPISLVLILWYEESSEDSSRTGEQKHDADLGSLLSLFTSAPTFLTVFGRSLPMVVRIHHV